MIVPISLCMSCIHFNRPNTIGPAYFRKAKCNSFPDGIPMEILTGKFDHRNNHERDNGVTYDLDPDERIWLHHWLESRAISEGTE